MPTEDDQYEEDLRLALALAKGIETTDKDGFPDTKFYESGSPEEKRAREGLRRLLEADRPLDRYLRRALAQLVNPSWIDLKFSRHRKLNFWTGPKNAKGNKRFKIATEVQATHAARTDAPMEEIVEIVAKAQKVSERTVWIAWGEFKHLVIAGYQASKE